MSLPPNWVSANVGEIFRIIGGGTPSTVKTDYWDGTIPWISSADISDNHELTVRRHISQEAIKNSATNLVPAGSVIVVTRVGLGKVAVATTPLCFSQDSQALLFNFKDFNTRYVLLYMSTAVKVFKHISRGTTINGVTKKQLAELEFLLPPRSEQDRIVAEIEKQFTRLDDAVGALKRVQANLKRYRASVLKAACEGRLVPTEAELARKEGRDYEPASKLLKRILAERRAKWEADHLQKMLAAGKPPKSDEWKNKYREPQPPNTSLLQNLPEGWTWGRGEQLFAWSSGEFLPQKNMQDGEFPVFGGNGINGYHFKPLVTERTIVVGRVGANCGNVYVTPGPSWITDNAIFGLYVPNASNLDYLRVVLEQQDLNANAAGVGQPFVNQRMLNDVLIPLPPEREQERIAAEIAKVLSAAEHSESECAARIHAGDVLRRSILKSAFSGKLVPQDPSDEPAAVLMERIRAKRARAQEQEEKAPKATNGALRMNGQRRRRVKELAQGVSPGKG